MRCIALTLAVAVLAVGCGSDSHRAFATTQSASTELDPTQQTSPTPLSAAVAHMQALARGLASASLPDGHWIEHLPDSGDVRGGATDVCVDAAGHDTDFKLVPFTITADYDPSHDAAANADLLGRADDQLALEGLVTMRSTPILTAGRVSGSGDGYRISIDLRTDWRQLVIEGLTPCVR